MRARRRLSVPEERMHTPPLGGSARRLSSRFASLTPNRNQEHMGMGSMLGVRLRGARAVWWMAAARRAVGLRRHHGLVDRDERLRRGQPQRYPEHRKIEQADRRHPARARRRRVVLRARCRAVQGCDRGLRAARRGAEAVGTRGALAPKSIASHAGGNGSGAPRCDPERLPGDGAPCLRLPLLHRPPAPRSSLRGAADARARLLQHCGEESHRAHLPPLSGQAAGQPGTADRGSLADPPEHRGRTPPWPTPIAEGTGRRIVAALHGAAKRLPTRRFRRRDGGRARTGRQHRSRAAVHRDGSSNDHGHHPLSRQHAG